MRQWIDDELARLEEPAIALDGLDEAIVGYVYVNDSMHVVYDEDRIVKVLMTRDELDWSSAWEWFHHNIESLRLMEGGPIFMTTPGVS